MDLQGTTAIVTGGASGLGAATAAELAGRGVAVFAIDLESAIAKAPQVAGVQYMAADVTDPVGVQAAVDAADVHCLLRRPCSRHELVECIAGGLERRRAAPPPPRPGAPGPANGAEPRTALRARFERALGSLWVAFQPILSASRHRVYGYEALVRTEDPEIGNPGALFGLAEQLGRVAELDAAVRARVAALLPQAPRDATLMVNVHSRTLEDPLLYRGDDPLARHSHRIVLEITERSSLVETPDLGGRIARLRGLGYRLAVDDLGAGYAGLVSLALMTPDVVKFDMELVRDVHRSPTKAKLIGAMTTLCRELEVKTVAEGIECEEESERAGQLGCDYLQGFHFARPGRGFPLAESG